MNTKALRQKVLDLAIHGKLVPQNPNDESATVLLEKIRAEKAEKIKRGELKADKKDSFIFVGSDKRHYEKFADGTVKDIEDEIPFDVPMGWAWTRLKDIAFITKLAGFEYSKYIEPNLCENGIPLFKGKNVQNSEIIYEFEGYIPEEVSDSLLRSQINKKCILTPYVGTIGNIGIHDKAGKFHLGSNVGKIELLYSELTSEEFVVHYLKSSEGYKQLTKHMKATAQESISMEALRDVLLPLPPKEEQDNIEQKLNNIFDIIRNVEINRNDLDFYIKTAKSKILDLAIHGKLVPQDTNDEPAEELLKRIATSDNRPYKKFDDEEPFDIPESWSWCTLGEIYTHTTGKALKKTSSKGTLRKYITTSNLYWNSFDFTEVREMYFTDDELEKCTIKKGDLILCNGGDVGRAAIWNYDYDICYQNHVSRLRPKNENINNSFFLYLMMIYKQQGMLNGKGVGITSLSASDLLSAVIPLPPYTEQQRIVSKIEELFSYLDTISSNLE